MGGKRKSTDGTAVIDRVAISLSGVCLVHCLAIPLALVLLPVMGHSLRGSETMFHWVLFGIAAPVSAVALWRGYLRHGRINGLVLGAVGLLTMLLGASALADAFWEEALTVLGVSVLAVGHVFNIKAQGGLRGAEHRH